MSTEMNLFFYCMTCIFCSGMGGLIITTLNLIGVIQDRTFAELTIHLIFALGVLGIVYGCILAKASIDYQYKKKRRV